MRFVSDLRTYWGPPCSAQRKMRERSHHWQVRNSKRSCTLHTCAACKSVLAPTVTDVSVNTVKGFPPTLLLLLYVSVDKEQRSSHSRPTPWQTGEARSQQLHTHEE